MTSYVMCNKKKLGIKKSDIEVRKKSVEDRKLEYFKSELLKILDKKEKEETGEKVSKAFIVQELYKSMTDPLYMAKGGKVGVVGEIRTWNGKKYKKMPNKKWVRIYDTHDKHTEISIAKLKGKVRKAQSVDELFEIVMNNTHRFSDENGKPLDIVLELKKEVDAKKKALNAGKPSTKEQIKKFNNKKNTTKVELTEKQKENLEKINDILNKNVETFPVGEFSEDNFKKLFENGIDSPIEHIKIGENQYQKLIEKNRQDLIVAMADVMKNPALIMKTDTGAKIYAKTYERENHKKTVISVIVDKGKLHISISTHIEKNKQLAKKMDSILFDRTESVHGDNASQEKTPDNSNIAQDYTVVNKKLTEEQRADFLKYAETLPLNGFLSDEKKNQIIDTVHNWIQNKDNKLFDKISDTSKTMFSDIFGNGMARYMFEKETGLKLPKSAKDSRVFMHKWLGENYDKSCRNGLDKIEGLSEKAKDAVLNYYAELPRGDKMQFYNDVARKYLNMDGEKVFLIDYFMNGKNKGWTLAKDKQLDVNGKSKKVDLCLKIDDENYIYSPLLFDNKAIRNFIKYYFGNKETVKKSFASIVNELKKSYFDNIGT